jgi:hypothetical protein
MTKTITPAVLLAACLVPAVAAADPPPSDPIVVDVEVTDAGPQGRHAVRVTLALAEPGSCAQASGEYGPVGYHLVLCRDGGAARARSVSFDLSRSARETPTRRLRASARLVPGKRAVVGKVVVGEETLEIAAAVR